MIISQHAAEAVKKLRSNKELSELEQLQIVQEAIDAATSPHLEEVEAHRELVNETVEKARVDVSDAVKALSEKENELIGARGRITELESTVSQTERIAAEREAELATLKEQQANLQKELETQSEQSTE